MQYKCLLLTKHLALTPPVNLYILDQRLFLKVIHLILLINNVLGLQILCSLDLYRPCAYHFTLSNQVNTITDIAFLVENSTTMQILMNLKRLHPLFYSPIAPSVWVEKWIGG